MTTFYIYLCGDTEKSGLGIKLKLDHYILIRKAHIAFKITKNCARPL